MDGPGTYSQPPYAGGSKDESGTAAKDTISIGSGDRVSGEDRMGMEVHMPKGTPSIITVPKMNYIAVRGSGNQKDRRGSIGDA